LGSKKLPGRNSLDEFSISNHESPLDEDVLDPLGGAKRILVGGAVDHALGIEHREICVGTDSYSALISE